MNSDEPLGRAGHEYEAAQCFQTIRKAFGFSQSRSVLGHYLEEWFRLRSTVFCKGEGIAVSTEKGHLYLASHM